ncbi:MAG: glycosyltransferase [Enterococcus sp.]|nr:glycosyltransferase [Enterococcus sp.]
MRILLVNKFHWHKGGSETYYFSLAKALEDAGHDVFFFSMEDERNETCKQSKYFVSNREYNEKTSLTDKFKAFKSLVYSKEAKEKFEELLQDVRPDIIHLNLIHRQITFSILDAPSAKGIPVVYTAHDYISICPAYLMLDSCDFLCELCIKGKYKNCVRKKCIKGSLLKSALAAYEAWYLRKKNMYSKIDTIIAPSEFMRQKLIQGGFDSKKITTIPNCISVTEADIVASYGSPIDGKYFLYFGRISKEKGVEDIIDAFNKACPGLSKDYKLVIAGEGDLLGYLKEKVSGLSNIKNRIVFAGYKIGQELSAYIQNARFSLLASRWYENAPYQILESYSFGTPVLGSKIGGIPELIADGKTGYLFESGNVNQIGQAMINTYKMDSNDYENMRKSCLDLAKDTRSQSKYLESLTGLYKSLQKNK